MWSVIFLIIFQLSCDVNLLIEIAFLRCKIPECDQNVTRYSPIWIENAVPFRHNEPEKCFRYQSNTYANSSTHRDQCSFDEFDRTKIIKCDDFVYKTNEVTILNEVSC